MKLTPTIYNHYKKTADNAYMDMYHAILAQVIESEDLTQEEQEALTLDIMVSNILGIVTSYDHIRRYAEITDKHIDVIRTALNLLALEAYHDKCRHDADILSTIKEIENIL